MRRVIEIALGEALGKLSKAAKPRLAQGSSEDIDEVVVLRVKGQVKKGEDNEYTPTVDIPLKTAFALLLEKAGYGREDQRQNAIDLLVESMTEALTADADKDEALQARMFDIDKAMDRVKQATAALPKKTRNGTVTVKVVVEELPVPANLIGQLS